MDPGVDGLVRKAVSVNQNRFVKKIGSAIEFVERQSIWPGLVALVIMMTLITANALGRYVLNSPIPAVIEMTEFYLMPALVFLALANLERVDGNVSVTVVARKFPERVIRNVYRLYAILMLLILVPLILKSYDTAMRLTEGGATTLGHNLPTWPGHWFMTIGLLGLSIRLALRVAEGGSLEADPEEQTDV